MTDLLTAPNPAAPDDNGGVVQVRSEPAIYRPDGRWSFFADLVRSTLMHDPESRQRLSRHNLETRALEQRVNPNTTAGTGGEFSPPAWLIDQWAGPARAGTVFADLMTKIPLPPGISSVNVPKLTTGFLDAVQPAQGGVVPSQDLVSTANTSPVVTIAGQADVSVQLFEQTPATPGFDQVTFADLADSYDDQLEGQLINGTGANGQLTGVANFVLPAANTISGAAVTSSLVVTSLWPLLGQAVAAIGNARKKPPEVIVMAPRRWAMIAASFDNQNRPIASPHTEAHTSDLPKAGGNAPVGRLMGFKVHLAGAIPAGATADSIFFLRPSQMYLYESPARMVIAPNPLSGTMQVRLRLHKYVAFVGNRFSGGTAIITNLIQPTNY